MESRYYPNLMEDKLSMSDAVCQQIRSYVDWLPIHPELNSVSRLYLAQGVAVGAVNYIAPAPFCCSRKLYSRWIPAQKPMESKQGGRRIRSAAGPKLLTLGEEGGDYDEQDGQLVLSLADASQLDQETSQSMVYVDKHVLLHRLYVGMDMNLGSNYSLHTLMASFLPETTAALRLRASNDSTWALSVSSPLSTLAVAKGGGSLYEMWARLISSAKKAAVDAAARSIPSFRIRSIYRT